VAWRYFGLGSLPGPFLVKATHLCLGFGLAAVVRQAAAEETASTLTGNVASGFLALSPLYWDTEAVGHMDLPLAFFATCAVWLLMRASRAEAPARTLALAGLLIGFLPWVKGREGLSLVILLPAAALLILPRSKGTGLPARRFRSWAGILPGLALLAFGALLVHGILPSGEHFAGGPWWERAHSRLPVAGRILALLARCLASPEWLGFWILFAALGVVAVWRRNWTSATLSAVVVVQLAIYASVYFVTPLDWYEHLRGSFCRIAAALVPVAILAVCCRGEESAGSRP